MTETTIEKGIYYSKISAIFGTASAFLIGDLFLTAYAIFLGLPNYQIGLLSTFAITVNISSLLSLWIVEKFNIRKKLIIVSITLGYLFLIPVVFLPFIDFLEIRTIALILIVTISNFFMAITNPAFSSWLVDLVPEGIRGRYFGIRNMLAGMVGVIFMLIGGKFLDMWQKDSPYGFIILFLTGIIFGFLNIIIIGKIPEITPKSNIQPKAKIDFIDIIKIPFSNKNFINLITFRTLLQFSVVLAAMFTNVYFLREIKMDYSTVALIGVVGNIFLFLPQKWWGFVADKLSCKPIIYIGLVGVTLFPLVLALTNSVSYYFIAIALCCAGWAAISIAEIKILFKIAKGEHSISYISVYSVLINLSSAFATLIGSLIISFLSFKVLFLISFFLRLISFLFIKNIYEPPHPPLISTRGDIIDAVVIFRKAIISDIVEGVHHLVHYILIPVDEVKKVSRKTKV